MRLFIASLATETNTFAPFPTGQAAFDEYGVVRDASRRTTCPASCVLATVRALADDAGDEVVESLSAFAQPAGRTVRLVYEQLRDAIVADLAAAGEIDIVFLLLHGAMVADGYDDCEGDLLARIRAVAPRAVIGVELDLHCHLTHAMVRAADLVVAVKEYPHVDAVERARELFALCRRTASGTIRPVGALIDTRMVGIYPTFHAPMSSIVAELRAAEARPGILTATIAHGFPWADVADVGMRVLAYADGDAAPAVAVVDAIARRLYDDRRALAASYPDIETALDRVAARPGRVVLGDFADNPGGGASGDSTFVLRALLARRLRDTAIGCIWDPVVAAACADAGVGASLAVRLGGKCGPLSGDPVDLDVVVKGVRDRHDQGVFGSRQPLGRSAWIRADGIDIVVCSIRSQVYEPDAFSGLGMDLDHHRLIVVKSSAHFESGFAAFADDLWRVQTPGAMSVDFASIPYSRRDADYFPRIEDPWAVRGASVAQVFSRRPGPPVAP